MAVTAFSPLGQGQSYAKLGHGDISALKDEVIVNIAERLGVSCAQVGPPLLEPLVTPVSRLC